MMKAAIARGYIGHNASLVEVASMPRPGAQLGPGEVLVRVYASSVNPVDWKLAAAPGWGLHFPVILEYVVAEELNLGLKPRSLSWTEAASLPLVAMTSLASFDATHAPWTNAPTIVILGGTGGCGSAGIEMAKAFGAGKIIATGSNITYMRNLGADIALDFRQTNWWDVVPDGSVQIVYDTVGLKDDGQHAMAKLKPHGFFVTIAGGTAPAPRADVKQVSIHGWMKNVTAIDRIKQLVDAGHLHPHIQQTYPLSEIATAISTSMGGQVIGKLAISVVGSEPEAAAEDAAEPEEIRIEFGEPQFMGPVDFPDGFRLGVNQSTGKQDMFNSIDGKTVFGQWSYGPWNGTSGGGDTDPLVATDDAGATWQGLDRLLCTRQNVLANFHGECIPAAYPSIELPNRTLRFPGLLSGDVHAEGDADVGLGHSPSNMSASSLTDFSIAPDGSLVRTQLKGRVRFVGAPLWMEIGCFGQTIMNLQGCDATRLRDGSFISTVKVCTPSDPSARIGPAGPPGYPKQAHSLAAFASEDSGWTWTYRATMVNASDYRYSWYGPGGENALTTLADGKTLLSVLRFDGNSGCGSVVPASGSVPVRTSTHYTLFHQTFSTDLGRTWSRAEPIPGAGCARPRLALAGSVVLLSGGRMCTDDRKGTDKALFIWAAAAPPAATPPAANSSWTRFSVADAHNRNWKGDAIYKIDRTDPFATQSYTSLVPLAPTGQDGQHDLLLVYNKYWCYGNCPVEARCLACSTSHSVGFSMPLTVKA